VNLAGSFFLHGIFFCIQVAAKDIMDNDTSLEKCERSDNLQEKFSRGTTSFFLHKGIFLLSLMITIVIIPKKEKKKISIPILEKKVDWSKPRNKSYQIR